MASILDLLLSKGSSIAKPHGVTFSYGTAGFRADASVLESTFYRMGILAALRAAHKEDDKATGIMITASHNKASDNGVKLVDKDGGMLEVSWEAYAADLANAGDQDGEKDLAAVIESIMVKEGIHATALCSTKVTVFIGRDTRDSSKHLSDLASKGVEALGGKVVDYGLLTTPQLHHIVRMLNDNAGADAKKLWGTEEGYYDMLCDAYKGLISCGVGGGNNTGLSSGKHNVTNRGVLYIDCAQGVGALKFPHIHTRLKDHLSIEIFNTGDGELNYNCGAEHLQKNRAVPVNTDVTKHLVHITPYIYIPYAWEMPMYILVIAIYS